MAATTQTIQKMYIAYFGRPADTIGLQYWADKTEAQIIAGFSASSESQALFGNQGSAAKVNAIYNNLFARDAEPAGLQYWVQKLNSGEVSQAEAMYTILNNAGAGDATAVANKLAAAEAFTAQIDTTPEILGYSGANAAQSAREWLGKVNANAASLDAAKASAPAALAAAAGASAGDSGKAFTLTASADSLTGTIGNDTFNAVLDGSTAANSTLSAADQIAGGTGTDTLSITLQGAATANVPSAALTSVENISVRNVSAGATAVDGSSMVGAEKFINDRSTQNVAFNSIGKADVTVQGNGAVNHGATTIDVGTASVTDAFTLNIQGGVKAGSITVNDGEADWTVATVNSTGAANTVDAVNLSGLSTDALTHTIKTLNVNAATNLTTGQLTGFAVDSSVVITGAAEKVVLGLGATAQNVDTIDASGLKGGVTVTLDAETDTKFVGGQGNDIVTTGTTYVAADKATINAGAGTADRLVVAASAHVGTAAAGAKYQGFEVVQTSGQNLNLANLAGITQVVAQGTVTLDNVSAAQAGNIVLNGNATATVNVTGANTVGQIDTLKLTVDDEVAAVNPITVANVVASGVENVEFVANDNLTLSSVAGLANASSFKFAGAGNLDVAFDAASLVNTKIDASASTGTVTINASTATGANGVEIIGSATKVNTLTGTANADKLVGGAANDVLTGGAGADVMTGGAGANTFVFALPAAAGAVSAATADVITDWTAGTGNKIDFGATVLSAVAHNVAAVAGTASVSATGLASFAAADNTLAAKLAALSNVTAADAVGASAVFADGGNTYVFVNTDATGTAADTLIQLTGVVATTGLTFAGGDITAVA